MSEQEAKRVRLSDLLRAGVNVKTAAKTVGISKTQAYVIKMAIEEGEDLHRKPGSGGHNLKRDDAFVAKVKARIEVDPTSSMRKMAKELEVDEYTIRKVVHDDLRLKSYARTPRHLLTERMKAIRSDKKIFTVDAVVNRRNDRYLAASADQVQGVFRTKHPAQVMVLGVVASDGRKMPPHFFKPGEKVGTEVYYKVLRFKVLPWLKANYPAGNYVWTQDGAPSHTSLKVQEFCRMNFSDFWPKDFWPSSSPDLNPLDFAVWGVLESKVGKTSHPNVETLKAKISEAWDNLSEEFIISSCKSVRPRVEAVIRNEGGHIE